MKTFVLGVLVGLTLAAAGTWAQGWDSFQGSTFEGAARRQEQHFQDMLDQQKNQLEFERKLQENERIHHPSTPEEWRAWENRIMGKTSPC
jgi:hypothetical protein